MKTTLYWLCYMVMAFQGLAFAIDVMYRTFGGPTIDKYSETRVGCCYTGLLLTSIGVFFLIRRISSWGLIAGLPLISVIGFASSLPGVVILELL